MWQELETDWLIADLAAEPLVSGFHYPVVIEGEFRQIVQGKPSGIAGIGAGPNIMSFEVDECVVGDGDDALAGVTVEFAEGVELLKVDVVETGFFV